MIWTLSSIDASLLSAFEPAGEPDQAVIAAHLAKRGQRHWPERPGVKRWYYLLKSEPAIRLTTVSMPLEEWQGGAFFIIGNVEIIGEFPGNRHLIGCKGLQLKMQPRAWMTGEADKQFQSGVGLLAHLSLQVLDLEAAQRSERRIARKYQWQHRD